MNRFWTKVDQSSDCWIWTAARDRDGYGKFKLNNKQREAHRVSWELTHGNIPNGLKVCHSCDTPECVRPSHLFLGSTLDNNRDRAQKGRSARGERSPKARLTEHQVHEIRSKYGNGVTVAQLSRDYSMAWSTVDSVVKWRSWK